MAESGRNQGYLGIDSNVLSAYLLPDHPDHKATMILTKENHAVNPTVLHETYHASVFKLRRNSYDTLRVLLDYMDLALCLTIDSNVVRRGLELADKHSLGGRDGLILAPYLLSRKIRAFVTMDKSLLSLNQVRIGGRELGIVSPGEL